MIGASFGNRHRVGGGRSPFAERPQNFGRKQTMTISKLLNLCLWPLEIEILLNGINKQLVTVIKKIPFLKDREISEKNFYKNI